MKQANKWIQSVALGALVVLPLGACGESESNKNNSNTEGSGGTAGGGAGGTGGNVTGTGGSADTSSSGGSGGTGGATTTGSTGPQSMMCDATLCEGLALGNLQTDACCPEDSPNEPCGVRTDFLEDYNVMLERECQPLNSPGEFDEDCPVSPPLMPNDSLSLPGFPGCCLPTGKCGFLLDEALFGAVQLNLGCIDSRELPNPDFDDPPDCDPAASGAAGAGGAP